MLGVLGGMGPLASAHFMVRLTQLTPASSDQEHIPAILWSDPRVPDRIAGRAGTGPDPLPWLLNGVNGLRKAGCDAIVIPCNTAHAWHRELVEAAGVPIPHIVDAAAADLRDLGVKGGVIGLMGTQTTLDLRLYQDRLAQQGWNCLLPDDDQMRTKVLPAIAQVKVNKLAEAYEPLAEVVNSLGARGAAAVVLGCTEIPIGIAAGPGSGLNVPVVDTIDALARAAIRWARSGTAA